MNGFQKSLKPGISSCSFRGYNFWHNCFEVVRIKCYEFQKQYRLIRRNSNVLLHSLLHSLLLYFITLLTRSHIAFWLLFLTPVRHRFILDHCHGRDRSTYSISLIAFWRFHARPEDHRETRIKVWVIWFGWTPSVDVIFQRNYVSLTKTPFFRVWIYFMS